jgi:hypothetical protein
MQLLLDYLAHNPWIWVVAIAGLAVWIAAVWVVFKAAKFRRKLLWLLLSIVSFSWSWDVAPGASVGVGIPLGALYILWFWRFGPSPSAEQLARDAERRRAKTFVEGPAGKVMLLRAAYLVGAFAALLMGWCVVSGQAVRTLTALDSSEAPPPASALQAASYFSGVVLVPFVAVFVFLSFRPYWWGKLLCAWAGLAWVMFGGMGMAEFGGRGVVLDLVLGAGIAMLCVGAAHQIIDPRFSGSYLRPASRTAPA